MKTVRQIAAVAVLAMCATTQVFAQAALVPSDLKMVKPSDDVAVACAQFFQPEGWGAGAWGQNSIANRICLEKVNPDCTAQMVYSWGTSADGMIVEGYVRGTAVIAEGKRPMIINASGAVQVVYTYVDEPRSFPAAKLGRSRLLFPWHRRWLPTDDGSAPITWAQTTRVSPMV